MKTVLTDIMTLQSPKRNRLDEKCSNNKRSGGHAYFVCGPKL